MNFDGSTKSTIFVTSINPIYVLPNDLTLSLLPDLQLQFPALLRSDRTITRPVLVHVNLHYRFTHSPLLFQLKIVDIKTNEVLMSTPYGESDFDTNFHTMNESALLDFWDSSRVQIFLNFQTDDTQKFVVQKNSFIKIEPL